MGVFQLGRQFHGHDLTATYEDVEIIEVIRICINALWMVTNLVTRHLGFTAEAKEAEELYVARASTEANRAACGQLSCVGWCLHAAARILLKWEERMYPGYQPKPDDVFHAVGYTSRDISDNTHFHLHGISDRVRMENQNLWREFGPLVRAMQSSKVKSEFVEVLSVDPFLGNYEMPYTGPNKEMFLSIEYLNDAAFRLCHEYGIRHPAVIEKVKRADIPVNHGITLRAVHYSLI